MYHLPSSQLVLQQASAIAHNWLVRNRHAHGEDGVCAERLAHEFFYILRVFQTTQTNIRNAHTCLYCKVEMDSSLSA